MGNPLTSSVANAPPQWALDNLQNAYGTASTAASTPYQAYGGQLVAGLNAGQQGAIGQLQSMSGTAQPFIQSGANSLSQANQGLGAVQGYLQSGSQSAANAAGPMGQANGAYGTSQALTGQGAAGLGFAQNWLNQSGTYAGNVQQYADAASRGLNSAQNTFGQAAGTVGQAQGALGQESAGLGQVGGYLGQANAYQQQAANLANPQQFSGAALQQYMDPYHQAVVQSTMANLNENDAQQREGLTSSAIGSGAYGGDRAGVAQAELARQQDLANNQTIAGLNSANFSQALGQYNQNQAQRFQGAGLLNAAGQATGQLGQTQLGVAQGYGNVASGYGNSAGILNSIGQGQSSNAAAYGNLANTQATAAGIAANAGQGLGQIAGQYGSLAGTSNQTGQGYTGLGGLNLQQGQLYQGLGQLQGTTGQAQAQAAGMAGYLGSTAMSTGIAGASAGLQGSTLQQQTQQAKDAAAYQQFQQSLAYPFQTSSFLTNAATGVGGASGGTQTTNSSPVSAIAGLGTAALGLGVLGKSAGMFGGAATGGAIGPERDRNNYARGGVIAGLGGVNVMKPMGLGHIQAPLSVRHATRPHFDIGGAPTDPTRMGLGATIDPTAPNKAFGQPIQAARTDAASQIPGANYSRQPGLGSAPQAGDPSSVLGDSGLAGSGLGAASAASSAAAPTSGTQGFTPDPNNKAYGLIAAGLGMMGGTGSGAQAIGQGGLAGLKFYTQLNQNDRSNYMANQELALNNRRVVVDEKNADRQAKLLDMQLSAFQRQMAGNDAAAGYPVSGAATAPTPPVPAGPPSTSGVASPAPAGVPAPAPGPAPAGAATPQPSQGAQAPQGGDFWSKVDPNYSVPVLMNRAGLAQHYGNTEAADKLRARADAINSSGSVMLQDGTPGVIPGFTEKQAAIEAAKTNAQEQAKNANEMIEVQPYPGAPTQYMRKSDAIGKLANTNAVPVGVGAGSMPDGLVKSQPASFADKQNIIAKGEAAMGDAYQQRQIVQNRLGDMQDLLLKYQTGDLAGAKAQAVAFSRAIGVPVDDTVTASPENFQRFTKNAYANIFGDAKALGGRILVSEINGLQKSNAGPEFQPAANAAILGQAKGILKWEDQHYKDYTAWKQQNPYATETAPFETAWQDKNPLKSYVDAARKDIAYQGQAIPSDPKDRVIGQSYLSPTGKVGKWNGSVFVPVGQQ